MTGTSELQGKTLIPLSGPHQLRGFIPMVALCGVRCEGWRWGVVENGEGPDCTACKGAREVDG